MVVHKAPREQRVRDYHLEDPAEDDPDQNSCSDDDSSNLQHCNGIALFRHPSQPGSTAFQVRPER